MKTIKTLSEVGSEINYEHGFCIKWGKTNFSVPDGIIDDLLKKSSGTKFLKSSVYK